MKILSIAVTTLLSQTGAAEWFKTGAGYPFNYASGANPIATKDHVSLEECKEFCNQHKDCTNISFCSTCYGEGHWCNLGNNKVNTFDLVTDVGYFTYSKAPLLEELVVSTEKKSLEYCSDSVTTLKGYLKTVKKYLGEEEETNKNLKAKLTTDDKKIK